VVNAGNANAFNGAAGERVCARTAAAAAVLVGAVPEHIFLASTGVIGEPLPEDRIIGALSGLHAALSDGGWEQAARAIMTTDTFPKGATRLAVIDDTTVIVNGIAKGSGMIAPDMATMLAFLFTDAAVAPAVLRSALTCAVDRSFNCTTVDGDTSTSDTVLLFATGTGAARPLTDTNDPRLAMFQQALDDVALDLAHQVVRDGEGATKFIAVTVSGAADDRAARRIALSIANSPLVKTAFAGADANWGRIVMAVGKAGEEAVRDRMVVRIGGVPIAAQGGPVPGYDEAPVVRHMQRREIDVEVDVGVGDGRATVWTCDLTHGYIEINAAYRT
jgi:glutamate N-acetyltransferase/amino-acid N-acetyltransferase